MQLQTTSPSCTSLVLLLWWRMRQRRPVAAALTHSFTYSLTLALAWCVCVLCSYVRYAYDGSVWEATFDDDQVVALPSRYAQVMGPVGSVY